MLILTNGGHIFFDQMREILFFPVTVHINDSSMENILSFAEVANIAGFHIKMYTSK